VSWAGWIYRLELYDVTHEDLRLVSNADPDRYGTSKHIWLTGQSCMNAVHARVALSHPVTILIAAC
jgi:hypothetical protein